MPLENEENLYHPGLSRGGDWYEYLSVKLNSSFEEFGEFCAFICSAQAGYLTGQNLLLDGGAYPGTF